ncbi:MAG: HD domain-containing protein [Candidatus Melainabacteria bacterium]|nr:HD domain-containing protein [Candidatus Melainabacteria bacterium]
MTNELSELGVIFDALSYASKMHATQRRKDNKDTPYINHPIDVARMLVTIGGITDSNTLAAAILHDTVEDTEATAESIEELFGAAIRDLVLECSDDKSLPKEERKRLQVVNASHKSQAAKCIKLADKISNVRDISDSPPAFWTVQRMQEYLVWAGKVVDGLRGANQPLEELFDRTLETASMSISARAQSIDE